MTADARFAREDGTIMRDPQSRGPIRTIAATIGMVLFTAAVLLLGWEVRRVLTWIVVAALLAIILGPLVDIAQRRLHLRRALATLLVFLVALVALAGILTMFIRPLASEGPQFIDRVPSYVEQARTGRGPVGRLVQRYNLDEYVERNQVRLRHPPTSPPPQTADPTGPATQPFPPPDTQSNTAAPEGTYAGGTYGPR
jgi:glucan phosphoethanolaminetransferase (alkaline phosphatase superfamily)